MAMGDLGELGCSWAQIKEQRMLAARMVITGHEENSSPFGEWDSGSSLADMRDVTTPQKVHPPVWTSYPLLTHLLA
jgi:hypothetical protein